MDWSPQQREIFDWFASANGNLVVRARAGTGKTTTIIEGISHAPEDRILLAAFNKKIAVELQERLKNPRAQAKTLHALGFYFVMQNWNGVQVDARDRARGLVTRAIRKLMEQRGELDIDSAMKTVPMPFITKASHLLTIARETLPFAQNVEDLEDLAWDFDCVPDKHLRELGYTVEVTSKIAFDAMALALEPTNKIDFSDMLYLPVRLGWAYPRFNLVCIDECQDMNACQLELAQRTVFPDGRIVVVGDEKQAIYGFRGADSESVDRLKEELDADELGLTTTYRCPRKVVEEANRLVEDFYAAPEAPEGIVREISIDDLPDHVAPGDFVLSRSNAPLTRTCLNILKAGIRAKIEGRDIGKKLADIVKKLRKGTGNKIVFLQNLAKWEEEEVEKAQEAGKEGRANFIRDQAETIRVLAGTVPTVYALEGVIEKLFGDVADSQGKSQVICSTVHKAKGLERSRVFILEKTLYPGLKDGDAPPTEERNIEYVAITRAMNELVWVSGWPS